MTYNKITRKTKSRKIIAGAQYTLINVNDGQDGQDANLFDGDFTHGTKFWSASQSSYNPLGTNVKVISSNQAIYGKNILEISNNQWVYAKNEISIEKDKIYKLTFRVRQTTDKTSGGSTIYAGATVFDETGAAVGTDGAGNIYFVVSAKTITVANGWLTFTGYASTKSRDALVNTSGQQLFPAVRAFPSTAKTLKPMFIVNYNGGNGIAEVDGLILEDATEEWNRCEALSNKLDREWEDVFNTLTSDGKMQGMFLDENGHLYINGQYINAKKLSVTNSLGTKTLEVTHDGNVNINANNLSISSSQVATNNDVNIAVDNIQIGGRNLLLINNVINRESSNFIKNGYTVSFTHNSEWQGVQFNQLKEILKLNTEYSLQYKIRKISGQLIGIAQHCDSQFELIDFKVDNIERSATSNVINMNIDDNNWHSCVLRFKRITDSTASDANRIIPQPNRGLTTVVSVEMKDFKIEEGNKHTDWSPAPEDVTNEIHDAIDAQTSEDIFNKLTDNGQKQGLYMQNNQLYVNGQYINAKNLSVTNNSGKKTLNIDNNGNVDLDVNSLKISSSNVATEDYTDNAINNVSIGGRNLALGTSVISTQTGNNSTNQAHDVYTLNTKELQGNEVTTSFDWQVEGDNISGKFYLQLSNTPWTNFTDTITVSSTNKNGKAKFIRTMPTTITEGLKVRFRKDAFNGTLKISNLKIEKGNKATDWTPAPEDVQNQINNTVANIDVMYYLSTSKTSLSGGSWSTVAPTWVEGKYMWSKTVTTYADGEIVESSPTCIAGATGATGATGQSINSITEEYYLSTSKTSQTGGSWTTTPPTWSSGKYIWTRSKIGYINPTKTEYTTPICDSSWEAVNEVQIGAKNLLLNSNFSLDKYNWVDWGSPAIREFVTSNNKRWCHIKGTGTAQYQGVSQNKYSDYKIMIEPNTKYTFSARVKGGANNQIFTVGIHWNSSGNTIIGQNWQNFTIGTAEQIVSCTFTSTNNSTVNSFNIMVGVNSNTTVYDVYFTDLKLEKGNKATDWSPAPEDTDDKVNNIQIGGTNLQPDSAFNKNNTYWSIGTGWSIDQGFTYEDINTAHFNRTGLTSNSISYLFSSKIIKCTPGETYTASVYVYTANKSSLDANHVFGIWFYTDTNTYISAIKKNINSELINNKWVRVNITATAPNDSYYIALVNGIERNGNVWVAKPKLEKGNKATDWSPAPSDLTNDIIDVGAKAEEALSTAGSKLNANQIDVFNALTENGTKKAISINNGDLFINATYINTGLLDARYLNTRTLNVSNDDGLSTFNVDSRGDVTIHGTIASTEFSDDYETGYKLTPDGDAIFKNAKINGEFVTLEGGISNYGTKNNNANLIKISQLKYKDATGTYNNEKLTWTITTTSGTGTTWGAGLYISGNTTKIPHGKTYTCSFEIKVPVACTWNVDVNTYAASGTSWSGNDNDNTVLRKTSSKSLSANVWTKCWFSFTNSHASNTSKVDLYDNSGFGIINNSGSNIVYEIRNIKGELSDTPTAWCPHNEEGISLVRFWAGSDYDSRGSAPFRVMSDGSIYASKGNFSGVFSGKVSIGNITIEDTISSKGSIEIKNNDNSKSLIKLNEDSSYFKSDFSIGDDFVFFDVSSKTLTNKGYIDLQNSSYSTRLNEGANIIKSADATGAHYQRYSSGTYVFDSRGTNTYGDFMFKRNDNANIDMRVEGDMYIKNKITMNNNIYILAKQDSGNSGYDFIID